MAELGCPPDMYINDHKQLSDHFYAGEFKCHNGTQIMAKHISIMQDLIEFLERLRFAVNLKVPEAGDVGIYIVSGYRPEAYNKECKGAKNSGHLFTEKGAAADVRFTDSHIPVATIWQLSLAVDKSFPTRSYRLGNYEKSKGQGAWVHVGCDYGVGGTRWFK